MATMCACGNQLTKTPRFKVNVSPCRCPEDARGPSRRVRNLDLPIPDWVTEKQYNERRRLDLPIATPLERGSWKAQR